MPVFSLPAQHGIGDFGTSAYAFVDSLHTHGIKYWQILPLNSGTSQNGESPYFSESAFAINPLLISLLLLQGKGLLSAKEIAALPKFSSDRINYDQVRDAKIPLLRRAVTRFQNTPDFEVFCQRNAFWLDDFALFESLHTTYARSWDKWPECARDREPEEIDLCTCTNKLEIHVQKVLQYCAWTQWDNLHWHCTGKGITVIGDMPIYVARDSSDCWTNASLFKLDAHKRPIAVSGVPPDYFSATGQLWNNPVYNWDVHERDGFSWWVQRLRHLFSLYDIVRIDHFRGLVQYWEIPAGETTAVNGAWKKVPTYALFDALMQAIKPFPVICEDLGIITDDVRAAMKHYGFFGMKVLQFAFGDDDPNNPYLPQNFGSDSIVYTGTHDNMPTLGWLRHGVGKRELKRIEDLTGKKSMDGEIVWDLIDIGMQSKAAIAVVPLQDILILDEKARINDPAATQGNWQWRWDPAKNPGEDAFDRFMALAKTTGR